MAMKPLVLTVEEERARRTLDLLKRLTGMSDRDIGEALGVKHQAIAQRREGSTRIHPHRDVPALAARLGVEPACFYMADDELWGWLWYHRPDLLNPPDDEGGSPPDPPKGTRPGGGGASLDIIGEAGAHNPRYVSPVAA
jgi:transcriptional regulator with XRE-family HTH domain